MMQGWVRVGCGKIAASMQGRDGQNIKVKTYLYFDYLLTMQYAMHLGNNFFISQRYHHLGSTI
jgi:hypothetical protein